MIPVELHETNTCDKLSGAIGSTTETGIAREMGTWYRSMQTVLRITFARPGMVSRLAGSDSEMDHGWHLPLSLRQSRFQAFLAMAEILAFINCFAASR
jgi:hypothetical protein